MKVNGIIINIISKTQVIKNSKIIQKNSRSIMKSNWVPVRWGGIGVWDDGQAGPCMGRCMGRWMGGAWVGALHCAW